MQGLFLYEYSLDVKCFYDAHVLCLYTAQRCLFSQVPLHTHTQLHVWFLGLTWTMDRTARFTSIRYCVCAVGGASGNQAACCSTNQISACNFT